MKISVYPEEEGYNPMYMHARVLLDGVELECCVRADDVAGVADCYETVPSSEANSFKVLAIDDNNNPKIVTLVGKVTIVFEDELVTPELPQ